MTIIYEDNHLIAVSKAVGEIVQGDKTGDCTLIDEVKSYIKERYRKPGDVFLGLVHRIDRPTSGVVVFARTSKALSRLNEMFRKGEIHKTYWAIVPKVSEVPTGTVSLMHWLVRNEKQNKSYAYDHEAPHSKQAILDYRVLSTGERYMLIEVDLKTGRHHQIRCQLSEVDMPIKGDLKYGSKRSNEDGSISLLAHSVDFIHPVSKQPIHAEAILPDDRLWQDLYMKMRNEE